MSRNERTNARNPAASRKAKQPRKPDARVQRTRDQLGHALITLIVEKPINDVTVQDVLDRAHVGRSTFYMHYRDKDDLLVSQLEMFLEMMSTSLSVRTSSVLPSPGTPSSNTWPLARRPTSNRSTSCSWPTMTWAISVRNLPIQTAVSAT